MECAWSLIWRVIVGGKNTNVLHYGVEISMLILEEAGLLKRSLLRPKLDIKFGICLSNLRNQSKPNYL